MSGDPGCFAAWLLHVYQLQPGEAIFVPAGEIHAYLQGDCVEVGLSTRYLPLNYFNVSVLLCNFA